MPSLFGNHPMTEYLRLLTEINQHYRGTTWPTSEGWLGQSERVSEIN